MNKKPAEQKISIWPGVIRCFHWGLVLSMAALFITSLKDEWLQYHIHVGYVCLGLVAWRIFYGFRGPHFLRFKQFVVSFKTMLDYMLRLVRLKPPVSIGHPPPSGWMIVGLLSTLVVTCVSGIVTYAGEERSPLFGFQFSNGVGDFFSTIHEGSAWLVVAMIAAHVSGVLIDSFLHRNNLTKAMITGKKSVSEEHAAEYHRRHRAGSWSAKAIFGLVMVFGLIILPATQQSAVISKMVPPPDLTITAAGALWKEECAACHQAFHPALLPSRSWEKMMLGLEDHFGDDASLDEADAQMITEFLAKNSADFSTYEPAYKIRNSLAPTAAPIAITATPYWVRKHEDIKDAVYHRSSIGRPSNCLACHSDAESGQYEDHLITIPQ